MISLIARPSITSTYYVDQAWMKLIDLAKEKVEIVTQWGIYNSKGYGLKFYERLEKGEHLVYM
jgi:hypothetical protein